MTLAFRCFSISAVFLLAGCTQMTTDGGEGIATLEMSEHGGVNVGLELPHTRVRHRWSGNSRLVFPAGSTAHAEQVDGVEWHGLRAQGVDEMAEEYVDVLARLDAERQVYVVRVDSTMPIVIRARFDDGRKAATANSKIAEVKCEAGERSLEVGLPQGEN